MLTTNCYNMKCFDNTAVCVLFPLHVVNCFRTQNVSNFNDVWASAQINNSDHVYLLRSSYLNMYELSVFSRTQGFLIIPVCHYWSKELLMQENVPDIGWTKKYYGTDSVRLKSNENNSETMLNWSDKSKIGNIISKSHTAWHVLVFTWHLELWYVIRLPTNMNDIKTSQDKMCAHSSAIHERGWIVHSMGPCLDRFGYWLGLYNIWVLNARPCDNQYIESTDWNEYGTKWKLDMNLEWQWTVIMTNAATRWPWLADGHRHYLRRP